MLILASLIQRTKWIKRIWGIEIQEQDTSFWTCILLCFIPLSIVPQCLTSGSLGFLMSELYFQKQPKWIKYKFYKKTLRVFFDFSSNDSGLEPQNTQTYISFASGPFFFAGFLPWILNTAMYSKVVQTSELLNVTLKSLWWKECSLNSLVTVSLQSVTMYKYLAFKKSL